MVKDQTTLWHDTWEDALKDVVQVLGGPKKVGHSLWPAKPVADAARYLNHCLDPDRSEKLALSEVLWLLREGAKAGCHTGTIFITDACHYERPKVINKESAIAELQRKFMESVKDQKDMVKHLERLTKQQEL